MKNFLSKITLPIKLAISCGLLLICMLMGSMIQTAGWSAQIKDLRGEKNSGTITLTANDKTDPADYTVSGSVESGILIIPKNATKDTPAPGIVFTHGLYNNREMQLQNGIEMARRGFVVLMIDRTGHGHNNLASVDNYGDPMLQAAKYLYNLTDKEGNKIVDPAKIAISGHSMGGNATNSGLALDGVDTAGRITVSGTSYTWAGATDEALKKGYHMGIISAGLVQANNASNGSYGSNLVAVGIIKASSDEFFFSSTLKTADYVAINQDKTAMTRVMFEEGVRGEYTGSEDGKIYVKSGKGFREITEKDTFHQHTQYYKLSKRGNSTQYLMSSQAMGFVGYSNAELAAWTEEQYEVKNNAYYNFNTHELLAEPNGKKLVSVERKGAALAGDGIQLRAIFEARETHPMNHFSIASASHVIDFFYAAFGVPEGARFKAPTNQTWWIKEGFSILGYAGIFLFVLCLVDMLLATPLFASLKVTDEAELLAPELLKKPRAHVAYWLGGLGTAIFGAYSIGQVSTWYSKSMFRALLTDTHIELTGTDVQDLANIGQIAYWGICCALFALVLNALIWFVNRIVSMILHKDDYQEYDVHPFAAFKMRSFGNVLKTLLLGVIVVIAFYGIVWINWKVLLVDLRFWTFDFRVFRLDKLLAYLRYVPYFFIFYMVSAGLNQGFRTKDLPEWATILINVCFNVIGVMIVFWHQNSHFIQTGGLVSSSNKLFYIACYPIIPCVACATVLSRRLYTRTGNAWLGGLINAVLFTFMACANTSVSGIF